MQVAKRLECSGAHGLVLSGGFVSKAPMYVMRGEMPIRSMTHYMTCWWLKYGVRMAGRWMIPSVPFKEAYFLEDALKFRAELKMPLIYVGGLVSRAKIDEVLDNGFEAVQMARALLNEPGFVNRMRKEENARCSCRHSNYCIARMYSIEMACHQHLQEELPACLKKEIEKIEAKG
jgi:2,4-dienoyl-CoA reductase-like NADH-dependent reductase (Old Yellow Enzyme family)